MSDKPNMIDFYRETARFMAADKPEVFPTPAHAISMISQWHDTLAQHEGPGSLQGACYIMTKTQIEPDGDEFEYAIARLISSAVFFNPEHEAVILSYTKGGKALTTEVNLPQIVDLDFDF